MDDPEELKKFIRLKILDGNNSEQIFQDLYESFTIFKCPYPIETIRICFAQAENGDYSWIPDRFRLFFKTIRRQMKKAQRAIDDRTCLSYFDYRCDYFMMTPRYALGARQNHGYLDTLFLFDVFHGQKRVPVLENGTPDWNDDSFAYPFNSDHFLVVDNSNSGEDHLSLSIHLFKVDFSTCKFAVIDKWTQKETDFYGCYVDTLDPMKFVFRVNDGADRLYRGHIKNGKIEIESKLPFDLSLFKNQAGFNFKLQISSFRLAGDEIYTLCAKDSSSQKLFLAKLILNSNSIQFSVIFYVEIGDIDLPWLSERYDWIYGKNSYFCTCVNGDDIEIIKIDLETQKMSKVKKLLNTFRYDLPLILTLDGDVLQIFAVHEKTRQIIHWRIPSNEPDKLQNLAMETVRRQLMFMKEKKYRELAEKLPFRFKPFEGNACLTEWEFDEAQRMKIEAQRLK